MGVPGQPLAPPFPSAEDGEDGSSPVEEPRRKRDRSAKHDVGDAAHDAAPVALMHDGGAAMQCEPSSATSENDGAGIAHFALDDDVAEPELNDMYDFSRFVPATSSNGSAPMPTPREQHQHNLPLPTPRGDSHYAAAAGSTSKAFSQPRLLAKLSARSMRMTRGTRGVRRDETPCCPKATSEVTIVADHTRVTALEEQLMKREREMNEALEAQGRLLASQRIENARLARQMEQLKGQLLDKEEHLQEAMSRAEVQERKQKQLQLALDAAQESRPQPLLADAEEGAGETPEQILNLALVAEQLTDALEESNESERHTRMELSKSKKALRKETARVEELERQVTMTERGAQQRNDEVKQLRLQLAQREQKLSEEQAKKHRLLKVANDANDIDLLLQRRGRKLGPTLRRVDSGTTL